MMVGHIGAGAAGGYQVQRSVRLRASASAYFSRINALSPSNPLKWTWSGPVKRGALSGNHVFLSAGSSTAAEFLAYIDSNGSIYVYQYLAGAVNIQKISTRVLRDPSAWYMLTLAVDTTLTTAEDRVQIFVDDVRVDSFSSNTNPAQNTITYINAGNTYQLIGASPRSPRDNFADIYLAEVRFVDGQQLTPASFGERDAATRMWMPKKYTGSFGANGGYWPFDDITSTTTLGYDKSGNGNHFTANNISLTAGPTYDSMLDVPGLPWADGGNGRGNYCVLNAVYTSLLGGGSVRDANTTFTSQPAGGNGGVLGTVATTTGQYYFEFESVSNGGFGQPYGGIYSTADAGGYLLGTGNGQLNSAYGTYGVAVDVDAGKVWFTNAAGAWLSGDPVAGTSPYSTFTANSLVLPYVYGSRTSGSDNAAIVKVNFGQRPFAYTPPTGFKALHTGNLTSDTVTTSGSFTGNASADGPSIWCNGTPETLTINGNAVTFGTHADRLANGFKLRTSSASYNASGTNTWTATVLTPMAGSSFRNQNAKANP